MKQVKMYFETFKLLLIVSLYGFSWVNCGLLDLHMPNVKPAHEDAYLCHGMKVDNDTLFMTNFNPAAAVQHAHHMLLYGCKVPGSKRSVWNCGEMGADSSSLQFAPICEGSSKILFSWAMGASGFKLPKDVSFMIGKGSGINYLVLQAHYKNVKTLTKPDNSGLKITVQRQPTLKLAGVFILATDGSIPAHSTVFLEAACAYTGKSVLHPFAFRVHTHKLGKLVSGYVIHNNKWIELGKKSPQVEQMFYPIEKQVVVTPNDQLAARCIDENKSDKTVRIGATQNDEMCNFYFMYWVSKADADQLNDVRNQECVSAGYPNYQWKQTFSESNIPDSAAVSTDGKTIYKEIAKMEKEIDREQDRMMDEFNTAMDDDFLDEPFGEMDLGDDRI